MGGGPADPGAPRRLAELAAAVGGNVRGDGERLVRAVRTLADAGAEDLAPLISKSFREAAGATRAGCLLVPRRHAELTAGVGDVDLLVAEDPQLALVRLLELLHPERPPAAGVHPTAVVGDGCTVDATAHVGPYAVIGDGSRIGARAVVGAHVVVGRGCEVGEGARLHPHSVLYDRTVVGARSVLHAGSVVGSDGFGYVTRNGEHHKMPQVGRAVLGEDVEVGANSAIDRGALGDTRVGADSKIDNLVQVAHNVRTGRGVLLCGQAGIAGSTELGDHVVLGGQSGITDHVTVGARVQVAAKAAVFADVAADARVGGIPAVDLGVWRRQTALARRLQDMWRRLRSLERTPPKKRVRSSKSGVRNGEIGDSEDAMESEESP